MLIQPMPGGIVSYYFDYQEDLDEGGVIIVAGCPGCASGSQVPGLPMLETTLT
jgi:hypothetical protein